MVVYPDTEHSQTRNDYVPPADQQEQVFENIITQQQSMKQIYDQRRYDGVKYDVGEVVVLLRAPTADQPTKLQSKYHELQVIRVLPGDTYHVAEVATDGREVYATTAHITQLKSWKLLR